MSFTTMLFFADANVLFYTKDTRLEAKRLVAIEWMTELAQRRMLVLNLQVLNEVCHAALRKLRILSPDHVREWVDELRIFGDTPIDSDIVEAAWSFHVAYRFSWFDCLLLSSANRLGCTHVLTEDMGASRTAGPLALVNPFTTRPGDILTAS